MSARKISEAWSALKATPKYPRSWSAWASDRSCLYVTLPEPDVKPDGRTIPLWSSSWTNALGHPTATNTEQGTNLRNAIAGNKPILGFRVEMSADGEKIKVAHHERLLPLRIIEATEWDIIAQTDDPICPPQ